VNVLQIQGTADNYLGGTLDVFGLPVVGEAPGSVRTVQIWAGFNGCQNPVVEAAPSLDVTLQVAGIDTTVLRYTQCPPGGAVELWTVNGGDHLLFWNNSLAPHFLEYLVDWLLAHPKP
jgi:poly(3-hydroxybutyrate) depolymerase